MCLDVGRVCRWLAEVFTLANLSAGDGEHSMAQRAVRLNEIQKFTAKRGSDYIRRKKAERKRRCSASNALRLAFYLLVFLSLSGN